MATGAYTYGNDFVLEPDRIEVPADPWHDQPVTVPLRVWDTMRDRLAELEHECADTRRMWADNNARVRELENENARLRSDLDAMLAVDERSE